MLVLFVKNVWYQKTAPRYWGGSSQLFQPSARSGGDGGGNLFEGTLGCLARVVRFDYRPAYDNPVCSLGNGAGGGHDPLWVLIVTFDQCPFGANTRGVDRQQEPVLIPEDTGFVR